MALAAEPLLLADLTAAEAVANRWRVAGLRVVCTNGCFDVLHRGHVEYLTAARRLGDALIVGLNADETVRRLKGAGRPVNPVEDRAAVLCALRCVDAVVVFDEPTAASLVAAVRPDMYVKGADYVDRPVPEAEVARRLGAQVRFLDLLPGRSTTAVLERLTAH